MSRESLNMDEPKRQLMRWETWQSPGSSGTSNPLTTALKYLLVGFVTVALLFSGASLFDNVARPQLTTDKQHELADPEISQLLKKLYKPLIPAVDQRRWKDIKGETWTIDIHEPHIKAPLGKKMLILDVDSRPKRRVEDIGYRGRMDWDQMTYLTAGMLNHYVYAQIHGYDYRFVQPEAPKGYHGTWTKVGALEAALKDYEYVVFLDGDALISHPEMPMEWLMNHWDVSPDAAFTFAREAEYPDSDENHDERDGININTGFIIAQRHHMTAEIFEAWNSCVDEPSDRYKGCAKFKTEFPHEQGVMSSFVRYDYRPYIKEVACEEANGSLGAKSDCNGTFVSHFWWHKEAVVETVASQMAQVVMERAHAHFIEEGF